MKLKLNYYLVIAFCAICVIFQSCKKDNDVEPNNGECVGDCNEQIIEASHIKVEMLVAAKAKKNSFSITWPTVEGATHYKLFFTKKESSNGREIAYEHELYTSKTNVKVLDFPCGNTTVIITPFNGKKKLNDGTEKSVTTDCTEEVDTSEGGKDLSDDAPDANYGDTFFINDWFIPFAGFKTSSWTTWVRGGEKNYLRIPLSSKIEKFKEDYFVINRIIRDDTKDFRDKDFLVKKEALKLHFEGIYNEGIEGSIGNGFYVISFIPESKTNYKLTFSKEYLDLVHPNISSSSIFKQEHPEGSYDDILINSVDDIPIYEYEGTLVDYSITDPGYFSIFDKTFAFSDFRSFFSEIYAEADVKGYLKVPVSSKIKEFKDDYFVLYKLIVDKTKEPFDAENREHFVKKEALKLQDEGIVKINNEDGLDGFYYVKSFILEPHTRYRLNVSKEYLDLEFSSYYDDPGFRSKCPDGCDAIDLSTPVNDNEGKPVNYFVTDLEYFSIFDRRFAYSDIKGTTFYDMPVEAGVKGYLKIPVSRKIFEFKDDYFVINRLIEDKTKVPFDKENRDHYVKKEALELQDEGIVKIDYEDGLNGYYYIKSFILEPNSRYRLTISKEYLNVEHSYLHGSADIIDKYRAKHASEAIDLITTINDNEGTPIDYTVTDPEYFSISGRTFAFSDFRTFYSEVYAEAGVKSYLKIPVSSKIKEFKDDYFVLYKFVVDKTKDSFVAEKSSHYVKKEVLKLQDEGIEKINNEDGLDGFYYVKSFILEPHTRYRLNISKEYLDLEFSSFYDDPAFSSKCSDGCDAIELSTPPNDNEGNPVNYFVTDLEYFSIFDKVFAYSDIKGSTFYDMTVEAGVKGYLKIPVTRKIYEFKDDFFVINRLVEDKTKNPFDKENRDHYVKKEALELQDEGIVKIGHGHALYGYFYVRSFILEPNSRYRLTISEEYLNLEHSYLHGSADIIDKYRVKKASEAIDLITKGDPINDNEATVEEEKTVVEVIEEPDGGKGDPVEVIEEPDSGKVDPVEVNEEPDGGNGETYSGKDWDESDTPDPKFKSDFFEINDQKYILTASLGEYIKINGGVKNYLKIPLSDDLEELRESYFTIIDLKNNEPLKLHVKGIEGANPLLVLYFTPEPNSLYEFTISKDYLNTLLHGEFKKDYKEKMSSRDKF